MVMSF